MATHSTIPTLAAGAFFGKSSFAVTTPSFQFSELQATVPERQVPRHTHEAPHLILVTRGMYATEARNQNGVCSPGTLIFNPAGTMHRDCFRSRTGKFLTISPGPEPSRLLGRASPVPLIVGGVGFQALDDPHIGDRIVSELRLGLQASTVVLEGIGLELIGLLSESGERSRSRIAPAWLLRTKEMIEDCAGSDLSVAELALSTGVHPVYLARVYRRYFGCSPGEYLRRCRLLRVQGLLSGTDLPIVEIALQCGFTDQSQMTRSFSKTFGTPPARYRWLRKQ
jgi:AraC family transcriptional regulator